MPEMTIEDMHKQIDGLRNAYLGKKLQHIKTLGFYRVISIHFKESDMSIEFLYETLHHDPITFSRPITELLDGRFILK